MRNAPILDVRKTAILARAIQPNNTDLSRAAARAFLRFQMAQPDRQRLHELLVKNQEERLTAEEHDILDNYLNIGMLLDILQAKARAALHRATNRSGRANG